MARACSDKDYCRTMIRLDNQPPQLAEKAGLGASASGYSTVAPETDNLAREVYGVLGIPIDALDRTSVLQKIVAAMQLRAAVLAVYP